MDGHAPELPLWSVASYNIRPPPFAALSQRDSEDGTATLAAATMKPVAPIKPIRPKAAIGKITDWRPFRVRSLELWRALVIRAKGKSRKKRALEAPLAQASTDPGQQAPTPEGQQDSGVHDADSKDYIDKFA